MKRTTWMENSEARSINAPVYAPSRFIRTGANDWHCGAVRRRDHGVVQPVRGSKETLKQLRSFLSLTHGAIAAENACLCRATHRRKRNRETQKIVRLRGIQTGVRPHLFLSFTSAYETVGID